MHAIVHQIAALAIMLIAVAIWTGNGRKLRTLTTGFLNRRISANADVLWGVAVGAVCAFATIPTIAPLPGIAHLAVGGCALFLSVRFRPQLARRIGRYRRWYAGLAAGFAAAVYLLVFYPPP